MEQAQQGEQAHENVTVAVRIAPAGSQDEVLCISQANRSPQALVITKPYEGSKRYVFSYDHLYHADTTQEAIYHDLGFSAVKHLLGMYSSTLFTYGQTGK